MSWDRKAQSALLGRTQKRYLPTFFRSFSRPLSSCCMLLTWCVSRFIFFASRRVNHVSNRRSSSDLVSCNVVKSLKQKKGCGNSINICLLAKKNTKPKQLQICEDLWKLDYIFYRQNIHHNNWYVTHTSFVFAAKIEHTAKCKQTQKLKYEKSVTSI